MINPGSGIDFLLGCVFIGSTLLVGLFVLFARSENIERPFVVGAMTVSSALISMILLDHLRRTEPNFGFGSLLLVCLIATLGFAAGRVCDRLLGPKTATFENGDTLGADLAD